jgi:2,4-dienoyl-CoA reductase-like NADH-dependent reductase (Old Yellow Enzyme family)
VKIPVIGVGRINTSEVAEEILTNNRADLVAIGRQLIADPYWPQKVQEGRESEVVACESCNTCFIPFRGTGKWKIGDPICKVNDRAGREIDFL